jgi:hypothetical protein
MRARPQDVDAQQQDDEQREHAAEPVMNGVLRTTCRAAPSTTSPKPASTARPAGNVLHQRVEQHASELHRQQHRGRVVLHERDAAQKPDAGQG